MISPRFKKNLHKNQTSDLFLFYHSSDDFSFFLCFIFCGITFPPFSFFFVQHLANWLPAFIADIERHCKTDYYRGVAQLTRAFLAEEKEQLEGLAEVVKTA